MSIPATATTAISTLSLHDALPISEIAGCCGQVFVIVSHSPRAFVPKVDFVTSFGFGTGGDHRRRAGIKTAGRSEEHTSELQSHHDLVCRLLLEKKKNN